MDAEKKKLYIERAVKHREADEIVQGLYWKDGKGCCVGCLAHDNENAHEILHDDGYGPKWLVRLADTIHEGLPIGEFQKWPEILTKAIPEDIDYDTLDKQVKAPFLVIVLLSTLETFNHKKFPDVKAAIDQSIALWQRDDIGSDEFIEAASAAETEAEWASTDASVDSSASAAAKAAEWAATWAAEAAKAATWAAEAAKAATWAAAKAAEAAAEAATWAAAEAAEAATGVVRVEKYQHFADTLIRLLENVRKD